MGFSGLERAGEKKTSSRAACISRYVFNHSGFSTLKRTGFSRNIAKIQQGLAEGRDVVVVVGGYHSSFLRKSPLDEVRRQIVPS